MKEITSWAVISTGTIFVGSIFGVLFGPMRWWHIVLWFITAKTWEHCNAGWRTNLAKVEEVDPMSLLVSTDQDLRENRESEEVSPPQRPRGSDRF